MDKINKLVENAKILFLNNTNVIQTEATINEGKLRHYSKTFQQKSNGIIDDSLIENLLKNDDIPNEENPTRKLLTMSTKTQKKYESGNATI